MSNVATFYHNNAQVYPDVAYLAEFLAVNYSLDDQVIDGKFKDIGIEAVTLPDVEANWTVLESKRANTILYVGDTGKKIVRNGDQSSIDWRTDSWINICNFISELEIETLNVFLRNKKVAYTPAGQNLLISAVSKIGKNTPKTALLPTEKNKTMLQKTACLWCLRLRLFRKKFLKPHRHNAKPVLAHQSKSMSMTAVL